MLILLAALVLVLAMLEAFGQRNINWHKRVHAELYDRPSSVPMEKSELINLGRQRASQSRVVVCGLACNIEQLLPSSERLIGEITEPFQDYRIVIFENNSRDQTRAALEAWQKRDAKLMLLQGESDHQLGSLYQFGPLSQNRMQRMARYRNHYLDWIRQNAADWDLVIILDLDLDGSICIDGLLHSLAYDCDAVAANGRNPFPGSFGRATHAYDGLYLPAGDRSTTDSRLGAVLNWAHMNLAINSAKAFIPVRSAFNGCAVYKLSSILAGWYTGDRCEHTGLHDSMRANGCGRLYLNPWWRVYSRRQGPTSLAELLNAKT